MEEIVFQTVFSGISVFVVGNVISEFFLRPLKEFKGVIGSIDNELKFYANVLVGVFRPVSGIPLEEIEKARIVARRLSCDLESKYKQLSLKWLLCDWNIIPEQKCIERAAKSLIYLYAVGGSSEAERAVSNDRKIQEIRQDLNIPQL